MRHLLLVDDEYQVWASALADPASTEGWHVSGVASVAEAEGQLKSSPPDLVLLDLHFPSPGLQGQQAIPRFRAIAPDIPIIVLTASDAASDIRTAVECIKEGAWDYFTKSDLDIRRLLSEAEKAARNSEGQRRRRRLLASFSRVVGPQPLIIKRSGLLGETASFGLRLSALAFRPEIPTRPNAIIEWQGQQIIWQRQLLKGLYTEVPNRRIELRYIVAPEAPNSITVCLLGHGLGATAAEAHDAAEELRVDVLSLLKMNDDVYAFTPVVDEGDLGWLLSPFEVRRVAEVRRSGSRVLIKGGSAAGFRASASGTHGQDAALTVPLVIQPSVSTLLATCQMLVEHPHPILLSITGEPSRGVEEELPRRVRMELELNDPFHNRLALDSGGPPSVPSPEDVASLRQRLVGLLEESRFWMRIGVASTHRIPRAIMNTIAADLLGDDATLWNIVQEHDGGECAGLDRGPYIIPLADEEQLLPAFSLDEAAGVFRLPLPGDAPMPGIEPMRPAFAAVPDGLPAEGCLLGQKQTASGSVDIRISQADLGKHVYILGQTGTGKSTVLSSMVLSDIRDGRGVCVIDPHGDLINALLPHVPENRVDDIVLFSPSDREYPVGLNLLEWSDEDDIDFLADEVLEILIKLFDPQRKNEIAGPQFQQAVRAAARATMHLRGTVIEMPRLLEEPEYLEAALPHISDPAVETFFRNIWRKKSDFHKSEALAYFTSKLEVFRQRRFLSRIVGQGGSTLDIPAIMDSGKVLLVNLARGAIGVPASSFLGMVLSTRIFMAAMKRQSLPPEKRPPFTLYIDEFQTFTTDTTQEMIAEVRKFGLSLVLAHQNLAQIGDAAQENILGNVGSLLCFRCGVNDAQIMERYFEPTFHTRDLLDLPNWNAVARLMIDNHPSPPFAFQSIPVAGAGSPERVTEIVERSRCKSARPREAADAEVQMRLLGPPMVSTTDGKQVRPLKEVP